MDTEEKPRGGGGRDGREAATSPGMDADARSPQKLEEAGRTLPWSLCRELSLGTPDLRCLVSRAGGGQMSWSLGTSYGRPGKLT